MANFKDKIVVITGGSDGIGKALVHQFLNDGAKVATCGRNNDKLISLSNECGNDNLFTMQVDVANQALCEAFIKAVTDKWGGLDVLINNAGISMRALVNEVSIETLKNVTSLAKISADSYDMRHVETDLNTANNQTSSTDMRMYTYDKETVKVLKKAMQINTVIEGELKEFLEKLENKTLGLVAVKFQEFADCY
jgi:NAD(P)-dependent dehydrogenase (short-subunit alcohol dehydrogenase family)